MIKIHSIDETFRFYGSLGARQADTGNGALFTFGHPSAYVRFWGDLHGFCAASVDMVFPEEQITRSQFHERYIGISFTQEGRVVTYNRKADKMCIRDRSTAGAARTTRAGSSPRCTPCAPCCPSKRSFTSACA